MFLSFFILRIPAFRISLPQALVMFRVSVEVKIDDYTLIPLMMLMEEIMHHLGCIKPYKPPATVVLNLGAMW